MKAPDHFSNQGGAALITSLIFLTVLTILGMSTLGTALLESRMAGNARDRNLALQAAEIGLRDAELFIRDSGRITGNIVIEDAGDEVKDYTGQACANGVCYNGMTWSANGTDWNVNPVWDEDDNWDNAIQYQRDEPTEGKPIGRDAGGAQFEAYGDYKVPENGLPLVSRQPEYLIETFPLKPGDSHYYYRITVRGYGMRSGTRVVLQEVYTP